MCVLPVLRKEDEMKLTPEQLAKRRAARAAEKAILDAAAKKRAATEQAERERAMQKQKEEPDEGDYPTMPFVSAFEHDTGGGIRVIRGTKSLS